MILSFRLTMPNVNSWNGKWSGEGKKYIITKRFLKKDIELANDLVKTGYYHYNFGDGWSAGIYVEEVDSRQAAKLRKLSVGFCGYDWMVESILKYGKILNSLQQKQLTSV